MSPVLFVTAKKLCVGKKKESERERERERVKFNSLVSDASKKRSLRKKKEKEKCPTWCTIPIEKEETFALAIR